MKKKYQKWAEKHDAPKTLVEKFDKLSQRIKAKGHSTDIYQYSSKKELEKMLKKVGESKRKKKQDILATQAIRWDDKVGRLRFWKPLTLKASQVLGRGTKWCTTQKANFKYYPGIIYIENFRKEKKIRYKFEEDSGGHDSLVRRVSYYEYDLSKIACYRAGFWDARDTPIQRGLLHKLKWLEMRVSAFRQRELPEEIWEKIRDTTSMGEFGDLSESLLEFIQKDSFSGANFKRAALRELARSSFFTTLPKEYKEKMWEHLTPSEKAVISKEVNIKIRNIARRIHGQNPGSVANAKKIIKDFASSLSRARRVRQSLTKIIE